MTIRLGLLIAIIAFAARDIDDSRSPRSVDHREAHAIDRLVISVDGLWPSHASAHKRVDNGVVTSNAFTP